MKNLKVKSARAAKDLSQEDLAKLCSLFHQLVKNSFFGGEVIQAAAIKPGSICHDASPTFAINSSISFA